MKVSVSHNRPPAEIKEAVDRSFDDVFKSIAVLPVQLVQEQRQWEGNNLTFSLVAQMGMMSTPIRGVILITDSDVTIIADLGIFERFIPQEKVRDVLSDRVKGLLK